VNRTELKQHKIAEKVSFESELKEGIFLESTQNQIYQEFLDRTRKPYELPNSTELKVYPNNISSKIITILEYSPEYGLYRFSGLQISSKLIDNSNRLLLGLKNAKQTFKRYDLLDGCVHQNCFFTSDHRSLRTVLFYQLALYRDLSKSKFNFEKYAAKNSLSKRKASQIWMLWNDEAGRAGGAHSALNNFNFYFCLIV
jgi:hypothetical protein